jgi:hypothetical protein
LQLRHGARSREERDDAEGVEQICEVPVERLFPVQRRGQQRTRDADEVGAEHQRLRRVEPTPNATRRNHWHAKAATLDQRDRGGKAPVAQQLAKPGEGVLRPV